MKLARMILMATAGLGIAGGAVAQNSPAPPPFRPDRTAEDYGYLRDPARQGDWSDGYKYIPLSETGRSWLSLGGEVRERFEMFDAPRFGLAGVEADDYLLQRILVHADLHLGPAVRLFAQVGAHEAFGKKLLTPPDEDHLDMQQLFLELRPVAGLSGRFGRQEMMFSPLQRFVSFRDGTNVRQNFDGGRVTWNRGPLRLEAFLTRPVSLERGVFDDGPNRNQMFGGAYAAYQFATGRSLDAYWFMLDREDIPGGRERRHSVGVRQAGTSDRFDWDAEAVYQFGDQVSAWAASADLGYTLPSSVRPRLGLRFDAGSGDDDPADDRSGGFFPLFPSGPYFNEANLTSWTNLLAVRPSIRIEPLERVTVQAAVQLKWREDVDDAVHVGPSAPLPATRGNREREIGQVYTLDAQFQLNRNVALRAYYLHHSAGDAIRAAGGDDVDFAMGSVTLRF